MEKDTGVEPVLRKMADRHGSKLKGRPCWLYLATDDSGVCKVGISENPSSRINSLRKEYNDRVHPFHVMMGNGLVIADAWKFRTHDEAYCVEQLVLWASRRSVWYGEWRDCDREPLRRLINWIIRNIDQVAFHTTNGIGFQVTSMKGLRVLNLHSTIVRNGGPRLTGRVSL